MEKSDIWLLFFALIILLIAAFAIMYMIYNVVVTWNNYELTLRFILIILNPGSD